MIKFVFITMIILSLIAMFASAYMEVKLRKVVKEIKIGDSKKKTISKLNRYTHYTSKTSNGNTTSYEWRLSNGKRTYYNKEVHYEPVKKIVVWFKDNKVIKISSYNI